MAVIGENETLESWKIFHDVKFSMDLILVNFRFRDLKGKIFIGVPFFH